MVEVIPHLIWSSATYSRILFPLIRGQCSPTWRVTYPNYPWSGGWAL